MSQAFTHIRWIFFDVGYTLFDETPGWQDRFDAMSAELKRRGRDVSANAIWQKFHHLCEHYAPLQWVGLCEGLAASPTRRPNGEVVGRVAA